MLEMMKVMDMFPGGAPARVCIRGAHWHVDRGSYKSTTMIRYTSCSCKTPDGHKFEVSKEILEALEKH